MGAGKRIKLDRLGGSKRLRLPNKSLTFSRVTSTRVPWLRKLLQSQYTLHSLSYNRRLLSQPTLHSLSNMLLPSSKEISTRVLCLPMLLDRLDSDTIVLVSLLSWTCWAGCTVSTCLITT